MQERSPTPQPAGDVWFRLRWIVAVPILLCALALSQAKLAELLLSGKPGSIPVLQVNGKNYVEIDALAQLSGGTLSFHGKQVTLTLTPTPAGEQAEESKTSLSRGFLRAAIEQMSTIREWHTVLATAIENQFPVTPVVIGPYQERAATNLHLALAAASTDADHSAAQLIDNEYRKMKSLSDSYLAQRAAATYINASALDNDPANQGFAACAQAVGAMIGSGQYSDTAACR